MSISVLGCPTSDVTVRQYVSFACSHMNSAVVDIGGVSIVSCSVPRGTCIFSSGLQPLVIVSIKWTSMSLMLGVLIAKSASSSSSGVASHLLVGNLESVSAA